MDHLKSYIDAQQLLSEKFLGVEKADLSAPGPPSELVSTSDGDEFVIQVLRYRLDVHQVRV